MIDLRQLRADPDRVRASQRARGQDPALVDELLAAEERRRHAVRVADELRAEQKALGRRIATAAAADREGLLRRAAELSAVVREAEAEHSAAAEALRLTLLAVPNVIAADTPPGGEADFTVLERLGAPPVFDFPVRDHLELGQLLSAIDTDRGAKVSGARFYFLTGIGALLELALINLAVTRAGAAGWSLMVPPVLVKPAAMEGTGFLGAHAAEVYQLPEEELYLVGTSEVPLAGYHMDEILDESALPRRYAGLSSCFRREAGSYGRDVRGIIRVHQFQKVELFSYCLPEQAEAEHQRLLDQQRAFLADLELPFRIIEVAAGDLGASAARKFDCEAWLPSQERYLELTSASNCTTFQARRLGARVRRAAGAVEPLATLNGTLCAVPRTIVALLENHQRPDGSVAVPTALRPWLGGREALEPTS